MKNSLTFKNGTSLLKTPVLRFTQIALLFLFIVQFNSVHAQAKLSVQGILKKANGEAVPDDTYTLTFRLYTSVNATLAQAIWTEEQTNVDVFSGIYSTSLGNVTPLNVSFNSDYFLGVTVGNANLLTGEMTPRIQLTSAPYALSLRGQSNQFPSTGQVLADSIDVNGNVLAKMGAPGLQGSARNGYGFLGERDSGMFTTGVSRVSLYVNNQEEVLVTQDSVEINGKVRVENLVFDAGGKINYNGNNDWRLVETDYLENDAESWKVYNPTNGALGAWSSTNGIAATVTNFNDAFAGKALVNNAHMQVFKKNFTPPGSAVAGSYTYVKVVFRYFFLNSWDLRAEEVAYAAFSKTENCTELSVGWFTHPAYVSFAANLGNNNNQFGPAANFVSGDQGNDPAQWSDQWQSAEMIGRYPSGPTNTNFWLIFGCGNDEAPGTESFGVSMIEIWVK